eukprot:g697.t1
MGAAASVAVSSGGNAGDSETSDDTAAKKYQALRDELGISERIDVETAIRLRDVINACAEKSSEEQDAIVAAAFASKETREDNGTDATSIDAKNVAAFAFSKQLAHPPPRFLYFDPLAEEKRSVRIKEIKLPHAQQTHEVVYEPSLNVCLATQMSNSVFVRIRIGADGFLVDDQDAWQVGERAERSYGAGVEGISGLHNVSTSPSHPGCVWLSLQYANTIMLVDAKSMAVLRVMRVPTVLETETATKRVGGPHCVRECSKTGDLWVALKGAVACHPSPPSDTKANAPTKKGERPHPRRMLRLKAAMQRACCSPKILSERMKMLDARGDYSCPPPEAFAVWRISPGEYDASDVKGAHGGDLFECLPSPPMLSLDPSTGDCFVAQDQAPYVMHIKASTGACRQIRLECDKMPKPLGMVGPGIVFGPTGLVWSCVLTHTCTLTSLCPSGSRPLTHHRIGAPEWAHTLNIIHFVFDGRTMYAIASDLLEEKSPNCLLILRFDESMSRVRERRVIPLPTQDCACHRIALIRSNGTTSVVISELASSKLVQIDVSHIDYFSPLDMKETRTNQEGGDEGETDAVRYCVYTSSTEALGSAV